MFYFTCNHVRNYFTIISAAEIVSKLFQPLKLFLENSGDVEHVGKYS